MSYSSSSAPISGRRRTRPNTQKLDAVAIHVAIHAWHRAWVQKVRNTQLLNAIQRSMTTQTSEQVRESPLPRAELAFGRSVSPAVCARRPGSPPPG